MITSDMQGAFCTKVQLTKLEEKLKSRSLPPRTDCIFLLKNKEIENGNNDFRNL